MGINYVSIYNGDTVSVETLYTAQQVEMESQLSYSCNVWAIQQVIKTLRQRCPKNRYSFITSSDLKSYQEDLLTELNKLSTNFATFNLSYQYDADYESQKIYYAVLEVSFNEFVQAEKFKIIALPTT